MEILEFKHADDMTSDQFYEHLIEFHGDIFPQINLTRFTRWEPMYRQQHESVHLYGPYPNHDHKQAVWRTGDNGA